MKESKVMLTFKCPVKWNSLTVSGDGRYCAACKKTVKDFTGKAVENNELINSEDHKCGSFYATQLHRPFGDRRDQLIEYYQRLKSRSSSRRIVLMFITVLLFLSGCRTRRLSGAYSAAPWDYKGSDTETAAVDSVKVEQPAGLK